MNHQNRPINSKPSTAFDSIRGSSQSGMRAHNERLVLTLVRQMGPLAKADIARLTGLSAQSVSVIIRALEQESLLAKGKPIRGKVGQPSVPMALVAGGAYFLGLKIGRRSLSMTLTDFLGQVIGHVDSANPFPTPDGVARFSLDAIEQLCAPLQPDQRARVAGLGIAMPFRLWEWAKNLGTEPDMMESWQDGNIAEELAGALDFPVYLCNDGSAACSAELVFGTSDTPKDFLYFHIGHFAGGGLVLQNALFTGRSGNAGALGSMPVIMKNGKMGQLVDVASLASLDDLLIEHGIDSDLIWDSPNNWHVPSALLERWIEEAAEGLSQVISASACLIDFEAVIIDGWLPENLRSQLVARTIAVLAQNRPAGIAIPEVREGSLGGDAQSLGAVSLPLSNRFLVDRNDILKV